MQAKRLDGVRKDAVLLAALVVGVGEGVAVAVGASTVPGSPPALVTRTCASLPQAVSSRASRAKRTFMPRRLPDVQRHLAATPTVAAGLKLIVECERLGLPMLHRTRADGYLEAVRPRAC